MKARWLFEFTVASIGLFALANCAAGNGSIGGSSDGDGGDDWSGSASSSSSSSSAGGGSGGGGGSDMTTSSSSSGTTTTSSSSSSGGGCAESPCKLSAPQCGCAAGEACTLDSSNARVCDTAGTTPVGGECTSTGTCTVGNICLMTSDTKASCYKFCSADSQCSSPGGLCIDLSANGTPIPGAAVCTENCDLDSNSGCPISGTACRLGREPDGLKRLFTLCGNAGTTPSGSTCTTNAECAAGYLCFGTCAEVCKIGQPTTCGGGKTCQPFTVGTDAVEPKIGTTTYGVCQ